MDIRHKALSTLKRVWAVQAMAPGLPVWEVYYIKPHIHLRNRGFVRPPFSCGHVSFLYISKFLNSAPNSQSMMNISQETTKSDIDITSRRSIINHSVRSKRTNVKCEHSTRTFSHFSNTSLHFDIPLVQRPLYSDSISSDPSLSIKVTKRQKKTPSLNLMLSNLLGAKVGLLLEPILLLSLGPRLSALSFNFYLLNLVGL